MIDLTEEHLYSIDQLINKKQLFAIYKMPQNESWHFVMQKEGDPQFFTDLMQLNGEEGFVIAPFRVSEHTPIVLLRPDSRKLPTREELEKIPFRNTEEEDHLAESIDTLMYDKYASCFSVFMKPLRDGVMPKLVLSRHRVQKRRRNDSVAKAFQRACHKYPNGYVYLVYTPQTGLWMGSTPEVILDGSQDQWHTVALAGTQSYEEGVEPQWDQKNRREQELVVHYVKEQLAKFGVDPKITGPMNIKAGQVVHRVSHFNFALKDKSRLGDLLKLLHPTPAVCGLPKKQAYQYILDHENHDRKYYSGFIGELNPNGNTFLFVNLRCMQISSQTYTLYAGGGLLPSSLLEEEWKETENKMQTMGAVLE